MNEKILDTYDFNLKEINGIPIYYKNFPTSPCIHVRFVIRTGAFDDPIQKEGLAHFLEHYIFTGSPLVPSRKEVREWSKKYTLNSLNATTSFSHTDYHFRCLPSAFNESFLGVKNLVFSPLLKAEELEQERKVILQEAWGRFQNKKYLAYIVEYVKVIYNNHTHGRFYTALGWPDSIEKITHSDISDWHKKHYGIGNFSIVLTGAVNSENIESLNELLKGIPNSNKEIISYGTIGKPLNNRIIKNSFEIGKETEQVEIEIARAMDPQGLDEKYAIKVFVLLIKDILNERFRTEQSLCYSVSVGASFAKEFSICYIDTKVDKKNISIVEEGFEKILEEIKNGEQKERYDRIKALFLEQVISREELATDVADVVSSEIINHGKIISVKDEVGAIEKVTFTDMARLSAKIFDPEYTVTEIILPSKNSSDRARFANILNYFKKYLK